MVTTRLRLASLLNVERPGDASAARTELATSIMEVQSGRQHELQACRSENHRRERIVVSAGGSGSTAVVPPVAVAARL